MSFAARRTRALIVTACLAGAVFAAPGSALAQSAGDDQYSDPLAGETQTSPPATTAPPTPQLSPSVGSSSSGSGSSGSGSGTGAATGTGSTPAGTGTSTAPTQSDATSLPNTGVDGRILAGLGLGLLLCGFGLRLRTSRERF